MNKKIILITVGVLVAIGAGVFALNFDKDDSIVATLNGNPVYESEIISKLEPAYKSVLANSSLDYKTLDLEMKRNMIKHVITGRLLGEEAQKANIKESSEFQKSIAVAEEQLIQQIFIEKKVSEYISDEKIKAKYDEIIQSKGSEEEEEEEEVKASHILFSDEQSAKDASKKISSQEDFDEFLKKQNETSSKDSGELDYFTKGQMPEAFSEIAFSLDVGKISQPIKTDFGWHIIKLIDKRKVKVLEFKDIENKIKGEMYQNFVREYINNLLQDSKLEILLK